MMNKWTCCICGTVLSEKFHINGCDYCREHMPAPRPSVFDETVRGFIIGGDDTTRYQFWRDERKLAETDAASDGAAIEWFKTQHPAEFAKGAEMRAML